MWQEYPVHMCLYRLPYPCFWLREMECRSYYWWCKTKNRRYSCDAHLQDGVASVSLSLFSLKAANTLCMTVCNRSPPRLPKIQDQQSLMLGWHSFSGCRRLCVSVCFYHHGSQYVKLKHWLTNVSISRWTVAYLNATIIRETRNAEPEILTDMVRQTSQIHRVDGYRFGCGLPGVGGSGLGMALESNRPVFAV